MKPTFSSWERAEACPASHALPAVISTSEYAEVGTVKHKFLALVARSPMMRPIALHLIASKKTREECDRIDIAGALDGLEDIQTEEAFSIDTVTGEAHYLGRDLGRDYPETSPAEICGTLDVRARRRVDGMQVVLDWKTGHAELPPAAEHGQVGAQALAVANFMGVGTVEAGLAYVAEDGAVRRDVHPFDSFETDNILARMASTLERVREAEEKVAAGVMPTVYPGEHCKYCSALPQCPAQVSLARAMVSELEELDGKIAALSPTDAGKAWQLAKRAGVILDRIVDGLKMYADTTPIPLPDGKILKPVLNGRTYVDGKRALVMLRDFGASEKDLAGLVKETRFPQYRAIKESA